MANVDSCSYRSLRRVSGLVAAALLLVRCGVTRCPENTRARFDQCVRLVDGDDSGASISPDAEVERGVDGADAAQAEAQADADADGGCDGERMWRDGRCVLKEVYVDALDGNDANDGTVRRPLKTFEKAVGDAVEGQIVTFEARDYAIAARDDLVVLIPRGVTLRTRPGSRTRALFVANGAHSLVFAGSATLDALQLSGFRSVVATTGEQQLKAVYFGNLVESFNVTGDAHLRCELCGIGGEQPEASSERTKPAVVVRGSATLTMIDGVTLGPSSAECEPSKVELIRVIDAGSLVLDRHVVWDGAEHSVYLETQGSVKLVATSLRGTCAGPTVLVWKQPAGQPLTATLEFDDSTFSGGVTLIGSMRSLRVRRSKFEGRLNIQSATSGTYDLGLPTRTSIADVGWNTFAHLAVLGSGIVVSASGNKWQASLQGADEYGHYTPGETRRVNAGGSITGENFSLTGDGGSVELHF